MLVTSCNTCNGGLENPNVGHLAGRLARLRVWRSFQRRTISIAQLSVERAYITRVTTRRVDLGHDCWMLHWLSMFVRSLSLHTEHPLEEIKYALKNVSQDDNQDHEDSLRMKGHSLSATTHCTCRGNGLLTKQCSLNCNGEHLVPGHRVQLPPQLIRAQFSCRRHHHCQNSQH